jgi:hypothetical protein
MRCINRARAWMASRFSDGDAWQRRCIKIDECIRIPSHRIIRTESISDHSILFG